MADNNEFEDFVNRSVELDAVQHSDESTFSRIASTLAGGQGAGSSASFLWGGGLLLVGAGLAALMPSPQSVNDSFWRVGRHLAYEILTFGHALAIPLAVAAAVLVVFGAIAATRPDGWGGAILMLEPVAGGVGAAGAGLAWGGFLLLGFVNFMILLLIIVAVIIGAIIALALFFSILAGMAGG